MAYYKPKNENILQKQHRKWLFSLETDEIQTFQNIAFDGVSARSTRRDDKLEPLREEFESEIGVYQMEMLQICAWQ